MTTRYSIGSPFPAGTEKRQAEENCSYVPRKKRDKGAVHPICPFHDLDSPFPHDAARSLSSTYVDII